MNRTIEILSTILPVFLTIGLGMLIRRFRIINAEGMGALRKVAVNFTLPAASLAAFAGADYTPRNLMIPVWIFLCCLIMLLLGFGVRRFVPAAGRMSPYLCTCFESGMIGFSLYPMLYGSLTPFAIVVLGQTLFIFTVYKVLVARPKTFRAFVMELVRSVPLWALLLGMLIGATGLYKAMAPSGLQALFDSVLAFISKPTSFLILLTIGFDLDFAAIPWRKISTVVIARLIICAVMMALTFAVNHFVLDSAMEASAILMLFIMPAPFVITVFSEDPEERGVLASSLSVMTLITVAAFSVMALFH